MGSVPEDPATDRPREWLALPGGGIRPVVSVPGPGGIAERWRMAPGWPACGPPAGVAGLAWVRAGPAEARSA